jgi:RNA polymerase sigma-70 factor (ECF subfamily)
MLTLSIHESPHLHGAGVTSLPKSLGRGNVERDDAALVLSARGGDRGAEEMLYRRHVGYVQGLLVRLIGRRAEAEDAVQETFVIALDQLRQLRDPSAFRGWLGQIAVSQARRRFRRQKLLRALGLDQGGDESRLESIPAAYAPAAEVDVAALGQLVARLAVDDRLAWLLRYVSGESLEEVAAHCGCSLATAKRRIATANAFLRAELGDVEGAMP